MKVSIGCHPMDDEELSMLPAYASYRCVPQHLRKKLWRERSHTCALCGERIENISDMHVDHVIPFSKGGLTIESNLQLTHAYCNLQRGNQSWEDWQAGQDWCDAGSIPPYLDDTFEDRPVEVARHDNPDGTYFYEWVGGPIEQAPPDILSHMDHRAVINIFRKQCGII